MIASRPDEIKTQKLSKIQPFNSTFPLGNPVGYNPSAKPKVIVHNPNGI